MTPYCAALTQYRFATEGSILDKSFNFWNEINNVKLFFTFRYHSKTFLKFFIYLSSISPCFMTNSHRFILFWLKIYLFLSSPWQPSHDSEAWQWQARQLIILSDFASPSVCTNPFSSSKGITQEFLLICTLPSHKQLH